MAPAGFQEATGDASTSQWLHNSYVGMNSVPVDDETYNISSVGFMPTEGMTENVKVIGQYAYVTANEGGFRIYDVSDPSNPVFVGSCHDGGYSRYFDISGNYAYTIDTHMGLEVIDISDPFNPTEVGQLASQYSGDIMVKDDYAYFINNTYVIIVDISDPTDPIIVNELDHPGSGVYALDIEDNYLYVAHQVQGGGRRMQIYDVTDKTDAIPLGKIGYYYQEIYQVYVHENLAYLLTGYSSLNTSYGLRIVDISDPDDLDELGYYQAGTASPRDIVVEEDLAYIAYNNEGLKIVNISNPASPQFVGDYIYDINLNTVDVEGSHAYLSYDDEKNGFIAVDCSNPQSPDMVSDTMGGGSPAGIVVDGDYAYVAEEYAGVRTVDISDPSTPATVSRYEDGGYVMGLSVQDNLVFGANQENGLEILDLTDPANPTTVYIFSEDFYPEDVQVIGDYAYMALASDGFAIADISNTTDPSITGGFSDGGSARNIFVQDDIAYVAEGTNGLEIINATIPSNPTKLSFYDDGSYVNDVFVVGSIAYLSTTGHGLIIVDVSDPETPSYLGAYYDSEGYGSGVYVNGSFAYMADGSDGLEMIDVSDPENPAKVGSYPSSESFTCVAVQGPYIYLAGPEEDGFRILTWIEQPSAPGSLGIVDNQNRSVSLSWNAPLEDGGMPIVEYGVYRGDSASNLELLALVNTTGYTDYSPGMGQIYYYTVSAYNEVYEGELANAVSITPVSEPRAPGNLGLGISEHNYIEISWDAPADSGGLDIANYTIYRGNEAGNLSQYMVLPGSALEYLDMNVFANTSYYYAVMANNTVGDSALSSTLSITTCDIPAVPQNLALDLDEDNQIEISWQAPASDGGLPIQNYTIYRGTISGDLVELATVSNSTLEYLDSSVEAGETYYYAVLVSTNAGSNISATESISIPDSQTNSTSSEDTSDTLGEEDEPNNTGVIVVITIVTIAGGSAVVLVILRRR